MKSDLDNYYDQQSSPEKECLLAMRHIILKYNLDITEAWKYRMPFFCYKKKMFCYLWIDLKSGQPYLGIVDGNKINHPKLIANKRSRMKIFMLDSYADLPLKTIKDILSKAIKIKEVGAAN